MAETRQVNFTEAVPALGPNEAVDEANRCLYCFDAPCIKACPTHIDIPVFIKGIATGHLKGAARTILEANILGATCARVCPTEVLCEGACVVGKEQRPVSIGRLQRHATDWIAERGERLFSPGPENGRKVAVVGGGPAGLACAFELRLKGYDVTIYEAKAKAGGLDTFGIVSYRLPQDVSLWEVDEVLHMGVHLKTNTRVGRDVSVEQLLSSYDAVFLGVGLGTGVQLGIPGENLPEVYDALDFIERTKTSDPATVPVGRYVAIVGAGNTAVDAATCAKRLGADEVMVLYRRTAKEMTAYDYEYEFAKSEGILYHFLNQPVRIVGKDHVEGIECVRMELGEPDAKGRRRPIPVPGSEHIYPVDMVIKAIGQNQPEATWETFGLAHDHGRLQVNRETFQTSNERIFAAGDCIAFGGDEVTVVATVEAGKQAARSMDAYLNNLAVAR